MAQSLFLILGSFMLPLSMFLTLSSTHIKANPLVSEICAQTQNPSQCNQVLGSAPGASTSDLKGLGYISINIALTNAIQTSPYIASLVKHATDKMLKSRYQICVESYTSSIDALKESKKFLDNGDIPSLQTFASTAFDGPSDCDDNFEEGPPAAPPTQLNDANNKLKSLVSTLLVIGKLLEGKE
ncbi:pectinesterase inhibitor-like [Impatiens glandulifera]|uniref:pectinesterase inhibitor-like n=1 Tax=Impatiens glandulifera TaxID=253017 RepID=UPI001FB1A140|nr:pectinesterase inhibitor-like [Impatiens glandulifera]